MLESGIEPEVELVVDGQPVLPGPSDVRKSPSELLSDQLEIFGRDPIYEETVGSFSEG